MLAPVLGAPRPTGSGSAQLLLLLDPCGVGRRRRTEAERAGVVSTGKFIHASKGMALLDTVLRPHQTANAPRWALGAAASDDHEPARDSDLWKEAQQIVRKSKQSAVYCLSLNKPESVSMSQRTKRLFLHGPPTRARSSLAGARWEGRPCHVSRPQGPGAARGVQGSDDSVSLSLRKQREDLPSTRA